MATQIKNLLAVSWAMPPMLYPRSIQVSRLLKALSSHDWKTTVLCNTPYESENKNIPHIDRSLADLYSGSYEAIGVENDDTQPPDAITKQWLRPALKALKKQLAEKKYSALITFAQPWVDHLIGLEARKYARIPWLAHFSDPWVDSPYYANVGKKQLEKWMAMERNIIRHADAVLFTNLQAAELVMHKYPPAWRMKSYVIPHSYDADLSDSFNKGNHNNQRLRLVYTGDFYGPRTPRWFLKALSLLSQSRPLATEMEVVFVGRAPVDEKQACSELGLSGFVTFQDQIPYMQSLQILAEANVLLLIDAPSSSPSPFLPSKLIDYLMFKKPILGLTPQDGASANLLQQLEYPVIEPDNVQAIAKALSNTISDWLAGHLSASPSHILNGTNFSTHAVGRLTDKILSDVIEAHAQKPWWQNFTKLG